MPIALALATLSVTREQWNGPPNTPRCEELSENLLDSWVNDFAAGERAFNLQSQSYICEGVDCDGDGGFSPSTRGSVPPRAMAASARLISCRPTSSTCYTDLVPSSTRTSRASFSKISWKGCQME